MHTKYLTSSNNLCLELAAFGESLSNVIFNIIALYLEPPSFVRKPDPQEVLPGSNVTFTSVIKGTPPFKVNWFRGSSELVPGPNCNISLQNSFAALELYNVDSIQSGDYTCLVSNDAGKDSCTTHLLVKG